MGVRDGYERLDGVRPDVRCSYLAVDLREAAGAGSSVNR